MVRCGCKEYELLGPEEYYFETLETGVCHPLEVAVLIQSYLHCPHLKMHIITKHSNAVDIGMAKVLPIIEMYLAMMGRILLVQIQHPRKLM